MGLTGKEDGFLAHGHTMHTRSLLYRKNYVQLFLQQAATWGNHWSQKRVLFHCDNEAIVQTWAKGSSVSPDIMALVRLLYFIAAKANFVVQITHIPGVSNTLADCLSCLLVHKFKQQAASSNPLSDDVHIPLSEATACMTN